MFDVIITGGSIIDGTGSDRYRADIGIVSDKIEAIGDLSAANARRVIDAVGHIVSPGFIDTHVHSDAVLLNDPQHPQGLRQGITTEILGQDGLSYVPTSPENYKLYNHYLAGILGRAPDGLDMSSVDSFRGNYHQKCAINTVTNIAHGALRVETCGMQDVPMTGERLEHAKRLVREGMEQGAVGLATGMSYHPQAWSTTEELVELCKIVAEFGGVYTTHLRDVNPDRGFGGGGVPEALEIGRRSGVKVHFSHTRTSAGNAGKVAELMEQFDTAKDEVDLTLELYPYPTGSSFVLSNLPSQAHNGGPSEIMTRLQDNDQRKDIARHLEGNDRRVLRDFVYSFMPKTPELEGLTVPEIAERRGTSIGEVTMDLLVENELEVGFWGVPPGDIAIWRQVSQDQVELLSRPDYMIGSDSIHVGGHPHPRAWGTFPRFLGRLRRQFSKISLEQMIQRTTDNPAVRFGLSARGRLTEGYFADIVVFDADRMIDTATYDDPKQYPIGIPFVLVNGQVAVDHERCTGVMAGQAIP